jgi:hypothetical protein
MIPLMQAVGDPSIKHKTRQISSGLQGEISGSSGSLVTAV